MKGPIPSDSEIIGVVCNVDVAKRAVTAIDGETLTGDKKQSIIAATIEARSRKWDLATGHRFYLCDKIQPTDFQKTSFGGMRGHRYFDLKAVLGNALPKDLPTLAALLEDHDWK